MRTLCRVAPALQVVAQVPSAMSAVLDSHVAQHCIEIERGHVKRLRHLRRRQRVLGLLVQHAQSLADDVVGQRQNLLRFRQAELLSAFLLSEFQLLPAQYQLRKARLSCPDIQPMQICIR